MFPLLLKGQTSHCFLYIFDLYCGLLLFDIDFDLKCCLSFALSLWYCSPLFVFQCSETLYRAGPASTLNLLWCRRFGWCDTAVWWCVLEVVGGPQGQARPSCSLDES
ncbi:hypothetical protein PO909_010011 [Leuciscus waleckii]